MNSAPPVPATLEAVPAAVEAILGDFFAQAVPTAAQIDPRVGAAAESLRDFVLQGGKRVRPVFAFAGWLAGSSSPERTSPRSPAPSGVDALRIAAALELVQACALIHDDIIDHSDTRRGSPTIHRIFERHHHSSGWAGDSGHHGVSSAILIGDLALSWADDMVHGYVPGSTPTESAAASLPAPVGGVWAIMRTEVLGGQYLDIANEASGDERIESAYRVMEFKTAAYTVSRPLELGATLAGAPESVIDRLRSAGHDLGIAFQLRDDLLGVFGDPEHTGKPSGDDLVAGKRTALLAEGLSRATHTPALADRLRGTVGHPLTDDELRSARTILTETGAVDEIERQISAMLERAVHTLAGAEIGEAVRIELTRFADRIAHRTT